MVSIMQMGYLHVSPLLPNSHTMRKYSATYVKYMHITVSPVTECFSLQII